MSEEQAQQYDQVAEYSRDAAQIMLDTIGELDRLITDSTFGDEEEGLCLWVVRCCEFGVRDLERAAKDWEELALRERQMDADGN